MSNRPSSGLFEICPLASLKHGLSSTVIGRPDLQDRWTVVTIRATKECAPLLDWLRRDTAANVESSRGTTRTFPRKAAQRNRDPPGRRGEQPLGGRQHYLRWCPDTGSIGKMRHGVRQQCRICRADRDSGGNMCALPAWLFPSIVKPTLLEIPLIVMDRTPARIHGAYQGPGHP